ncbi:roadblock/LC7 domain-containing protein [Methanothermococcus sp. SCGC AD-155-E23]|nr:roadblock/LC7 domain-containing protein [Methanothermococcus sp. SCGC AD-155-E23]
MDPILFFLLSFFIGLVLVIVGWYLYQLKKERERMLEKEKLEEEIVSSLLELKKYTTESIGEETLSDKFDLLEVALENDVSSITITSEEGLPIVSTIKDPEEIAANYSALFQQICRISKHIPKRISIKFEDYYIHIIPIVVDGVIFYAIVRSNFELEPVSEKKLIGDIVNVLEDYIPS